MEVNDNISEFTPIPVFSERPYLTYGMKLLSILIILIVLALPVWCRAESKSDKQLPWERYVIQAGYFSAELDTSLRIGAGVGLDIDAERALNLESSMSVFRLDGFWRFSDNLKHRLDVGWYSLRRDAYRTLGEDIVIEKDDGEEIVIEAGTNVNSWFDIDFYKLSYSYSFIQDDRLDLAFGLGVYVAPISVGIDAVGLVEGDAKENFIAPLPTIALRLDIALTAEWFLRYQTDWLYLKIDTYKGSILQSQIALEYKPWQHVGIGLAVDTMQIKVEADDDEIYDDFKGVIEFGYSGLTLYAKLFF